MIDSKYKIEKMDLSNLLFEKNKVTFQAVSPSVTPEQLSFEGILMDNRLMLTEAHSAKDVLSFIRQSELTKLRALVAH